MEPRRGNPDRERRPDIPPYGSRDREFRETFQHLSAQQLDDVTDAISRNRARIYLLGGRFTDPIASIWPRT